MFVLSCASFKRADYLLPAYPRRRPVPRSDFRQ